MYQKTPVRGRPRGRQNRSDIIAMPMYYCTLGVYRYTEGRIARSLDLIGARNSRDSIVRGDGS